jgi:Spy/CpxP family protein refolding chaperone
MKPKLISVFVGAAAAMALVVTPLAALAQAQQTPARPAPQTPSRPTQARPRIQLSQEQQSKFEDIQKQARTEIEAILTAEQKQQLAAAIQSGQGLGGIQNLSDTQKTRIMAVLQSANDKIGNILTPEQKQQIEQSQPSTR